MAKKEDAELIARYADMLSAMGTEPRLRIIRLLLSAHPEGMVVGEELGIPSSTLSHHLEKLKTRTWCASGAKARTFGIRPIRKRCRSFSASSTPNAARGTRLCTATRL
jgi:hypothetical protein